MIEAFIELSIFLISILIIKYYAQNNSTYNKVVEYCIKRRYIKIIILILCSILLGVFDELKIESYVIIKYFGIFFWVLLTTFLFQIMFNFKKKKKNYDPYDYNDNIRTLNKILGILKTNNIITDNAEYKTHKNKKELITSCIIDIEQDFKLLICIVNNKEYMSVQTSIYTSYYNNIEHTKLNISKISFLDEIIRNLINNDKILIKKYNKKVKKMKKVIDKIYKNTKLKKKTKNKMLKWLSDVEDKILYKFYKDEINDYTKMYKWLTNHLGFDLEKFNHIKGKHIIDNEFTFAYDIYDNNMKYIVVYDISVISDSHMN